MVTHGNQWNANEIARFNKLMAEGYTDKGWANAGAKLSNIATETIDLSLRRRTGTNVVHVDHKRKELIHVDSSD